MVLREIRRQGYLQDLLETSERHSPLNKVSSL